MNLLFFKIHEYIIHNYFYRVTGTIWHESTVKSVLPKGTLTAAGVVTFIYRKKLFLWILWISRLIGSEKCRDKIRF